MSATETFTDLTGMSHYDPILKVTFTVIGNRQLVEPDRGEAFWVWDVEADDGFGITHTAEEALYHYLGLA